MTQNNETNVTSRSPTPIRPHLACRCIAMSTAISHERPSDLGDPVNPSTSPLSDALPLWPLCVRRPNSTKLYRACTVKQLTSRSIAHQGGLLYIRVQCGHRENFESGTGYVCGSRTCSPQFILTIYCCTNEHVRSKLVVVIDIDTRRQRVGYRGMSCVSLRTTTRRPKCNISIQTLLIRITCTI